MRPKHRIQRDNWLHRQPRVTNTDVALAVAGHALYWSLEKGAEALEAAARELGAARRAGLRRWAARHVRNSLMRKPLGYRVWALKEAVLP